MGNSQHLAASHHLPAFITAPGDTDVLMVVMGFVVLAAILGFGILFFRIHSLPERIAHKSQRLQFEIVAVLGLISLFTHMHIFWVIGLLLALIEFPDFGTPLRRIARSSEKIAGIPSEHISNDAPLVPGVAHMGEANGSAAQDIDHEAKDRRTNASKLGVVPPRP
jgi:hypothetical protein